jgi:hypothetical protein
MRLLGEIIVIGALIYIGWAAPFRDYLPATISGVAKSTTTQTAPPSQARPIARASSASTAATSTSIPSGAWMWDPNRHSALDRPTPKQHRP